MHPRNKNAGGYDLAALAVTSPALAKYVRPSPAGEPTVDFANPGAVKALNRALLMHHYAVRGWDLPTGYLCPPIPGRADYIHALADLLADDNQGNVPTGNKIYALDIGTGANLVYPLIGHAEYGWSFVGSEIDLTALANAEKILSKNPGLGKTVEVREQTSPNDIFMGLLRHGEYFDVSLCNPPFHASPEDVRAASQRKWNKLGKPGAKKGSPTPHLNFGGGDLELWCPGGERGFLKTMIEQSATISKRVLWFTSLVSKADNLPTIEAALKQAHAQATRIIPMAQGQKQSRIVAWTFHSPREHQAWKKRRWASQGNNSDRNSRTAAETPPEATPAE